LLYDGAQPVCGTIVSAFTLSRVFHVRKSHWKTQKTPRASHRPLALDSDQSTATMRFVEAKHADRDFLKFTNIVHFVEVQFGKCLTDGGGRNCLVQHDDAMSRALALSHEQVRLALRRLFLDDDEALFSTASCSPQPHELAISTNLASVMGKNARSNQL
jgi:hypothetical protein